MKIAVSTPSFSKNETLRSELLKLFPSARFNDSGANLAGDSLVKFLGDSTAAIIGLEKIGEQELQKLPALKIISKFGVGLDNLDLDALKKHGVELGWTGGVNARSVGELALTFALGQCRGILKATNRLRNGEWKKDGGFQLSGKTVGIVGCGFVGRDFVQMLKPFGCRILINDIIDISKFCSETGAKSVPIEKLFNESDVVSIHIPYEKSTHHLIGEKQFASMKKGAIFINTSRGGIVDEKALYSALQSGQLQSAAMDVFGIEPTTDNPLLKLDNFFGTPHIGGNAREAVLAMGMAAIENLDRLAKKSCAE